MIRTIIITAIVFALVCVGATVAYIYSGTYDVAATAPDSPLVSWVLETTSENSVSRQARSVTPPPSLDEAGLIATGAGHYHEDCEICHGGPGVERSELSRGLNPSPPDLGKSAQEMTPAELFWVAKNGIKMTGMPAWGPTHSDQELWAIVAFLRRLHALSPQQFEALAHRQPSPNGSQHGGG